MNLNIVQKLSRLFDPSDRKLIVGLIGMMFVNAFLETLGISLIIPVLAAGSSPETLEGFEAYRAFTQEYGTPTQGSLLLGSSLVLLVIYAIKNVYLIIQKHFILKFIYTRKVALSQRLLSSLLSKPYAFHLTHNSSRSIRIVNDEVDLTFRRVMMGMADLLVEAIVIVAVLSLLLVVEPVGALAMFALMGGAAGLFLRSIRRRTGVLGKAIQIDARDMVKWVQQSLGGIKESKVSKREEFFVDAYVESSTGYAEAVRRLELLRAIPRPLIETIGIAGLSLLILLMLQSGRSTEEILPSLGLFGMSAVRLLPSLNRIVNAMTSIRGHLPMLDSVVESLDEYDLMDGIQARATPPKPALMRDRLCVEGITFGYTETPVLDGLSVTIERGQSVGIVGTSGAGKSTLVNVILGLFEPSSGAITLDGRSWRDDGPGWQRRFGYVSQSTYLCDDTIRRNIAFGVRDEEIDEARLEEVLEMARLDDFINEQEDGLDTMVGEQGARLSGGQQQRLGIARALYHDPDILIMDEATSSLDNITEREISDTLSTLGRDKTTLIIAHRLSSVKRCDKIIVLERGRVLEEGTYEELERDSEVFQKLVHAWSEGEHGEAPEAAAPHRS